MATEAKLDLVTEAVLGNKGLVVSVTGSTEGHLMVGKASLVWFEKHKKTRARKVTWDQFHTWILSHPEVDATRP